MKGSLSVDEYREMRAAVARNSEALEEYAAAQLRVEYTRKAALAIFSRAGAVIGIEPYYLDFNTGEFWTRDDDAAKTFKEFDTLKDDGSGN